MSQLRISRDILLIPSSEEDVSQTLYKDTLKALNVEVAPQSALAMTAKKDNKVNRICDGFLVALEKRSDTNLHNLITAHVCKLPPDLEAGLRLVARLRGSSSHTFCQLITDLVQRRALNTQRTLWNISAS